MWDFVGFVVKYETERQNLLYQLNQCKMEAEEALESIKEILRQSKKELTPIEGKVFVEIWKGTTYSDMMAVIYKSNGKPYSESHFRDVGSKQLFPKLRKVLNNENIDKNNLREEIENLLKKNPDQILTEITDKNVTISEKSDTCANPFVPLSGKVDNPEKFFGREKEIREILDFLISSCNVSLIGEDGIGKSSLLWSICQQNEKLIKLNRTLVFMDLNDNIDSQESFYEKLFSSIGISEDLGFRKSQQELEKQRILLILDNIYTFSLPAFTPGFRGKLRYLSEGMNSPLKLVVAANQSLPELFRDGENGIHSPLEANFQPIDILPWDEKIIHNFIAKRLQTTKIKFTETEIQELIQESGGHPQKLTQRCYDLYKKYSESSI